VTTRIRHVPALDGLRGVAIAGVLLFHGGHLQGGYLGVDLFFVLSGYLITSLLLAEAGAGGRVALGAFWARRARRLLPALALVLLAVAVYAALLAQPSELHQIRMDALATVAYVANWRFVFAHVSYWSLFASPSPLQHTWSLAIEEQFYILWPLVIGGVLWAQSRRRDMRPTARSVLVLAGVLAIASGAWGVVLYRLAGGNRVYYGTDTRVAAILLGAALAAALSLRGPATTRRGRAGVEVAGIAGVVGLAIAWVALPGTSPLLYQGALFACSVAALAVIAAATHPSPGPLARVLQARPLVWLGLISYGVYLWHWPVFLWVSRDSRLQGWGLFATQLAITLAVSVVSFVLVERPIRRGALRLPPARVVVPATAVAVVAAVVLSTAGSPPVSATAGQADTLRTLSPALTAGSSGPPRLMVVGNSVPYFLAREGFEQLSTRPSLLVLNGAFPTCAFPPEADAYRLNESDGNNFLPQTVGCSQGWAAGVDAFRPDVVLFTIGALVGEYRDARTGTWLRPCTAGFDSWFAAALHDAAGVLTRDGAHLVIATSAYSEYYGIPPGRSVQTDCMNRIERDLGAKDPRVSVVDLAHYVCPTVGACRESIDGVPMRPDGLHYRNQSARAIAAWLLRQLGLRTGTGAPVVIGPSLVSGPHTTSVTAP
jgi:peptidoglycan/LPS O-acetylase OafA/YrhL